jgi:hypothetical protein
LDAPIAGMLGNTVIALDLFFMKKSIKKADVSTSYVSILNEHFQQDM